MNILITGAHGFVGSNLVKALSKTNIIYGLDIVCPQKEGVKYTFSWDYLEQPDGIPDVDAIIHLAGKAHDTKNQSAADVYFKVNRDLTIKMFDYFCSHPRKNGGTGNPVPVVPSRWFLAMWVMLPLNSIML